MPLGVVDPIAVGEMDDPFAVVVLLVRRQHHSVGQNIVDEVDAHGGGKSEIADLDRCRPVGQYRRARLLGVALEIDGDVDVESAQELRRLPVAAQTDIVEPIKCFDEPGTDLAAVVGTIGDAQYLEPIAVVELEQLRDLPGRRMAIERR